jgi:hypothetical protein
MFEAMPSEGLVPDYDSYSAVILSYLKESVRAYRQFATSHPGESRWTHPAVILLCFKPWFAHTARSTPATQVRKTAAGPASGGCMASLPLLSLLRLLDATGASDLQEQLRALDSG